MRAGSMRMVKFSRVVLGGVMVGRVRIFMMSRVIDFHLNNYSCKLYVIN